jgi:hypothetical protein
MGTSFFFPEDKPASREADHSPTSSAKVKSAWSYTSTPPIRLHGVVLSLKKAQEQRYLYILPITIVIV